MVEMLGYDDVYRVKFDMCRYGMHIDGVPVRKPTVVMTNSFESARRLQRKCKDKMMG